MERLSSGQFARLLTPSFLGRGAVAFGRNSRGAISAANARDACRGPMAEPGIRLRDGRDWQWRFSFRKRGRVPRAYLPLEGRSERRGLPKPIRVGVSAPELSTPTRSVLLAQATRVPPLKGEACMNAPAFLPAGSSGFNFFEFTAVHIAPPVPASGIRRGCHRPRGDAVDDIPEACRVLWARPARDRVWLHRAVSSVARGA